MIYSQANPLKINPLDPPLPELTRKLGQLPCESHNEGHFYFGLTYTSLTVHLQCDIMKMQR